MRRDFALMGCCWIAGGLALLLARGELPPPAAAQVAGRLETIQEIPSDTLGDVAVAEYGEHGSVIYYNPAALEALGPVGIFLMAHERGHIALRHTRANALLAGRSALDSVLQGRELAADCYAARSLGPESREVTLAAVRFFSRLGGVRFDTAHPSGSRRAATILACMRP